jgi:hypothetical protein
VELNESTKMHKKEGPAGDVLLAHKAETWKAEGMRPRSFIFEMRKERSRKRESGSCPAGITDSRGGSRILAAIHVNALDS